MSDRCRQYRLLQAIRSSVSTSSPSARAGLDLEELWLRYVALGGNADPMEVDGYLHGLVLLTPGEHNVLACAVNERLDELGDGHVRVPYCWRGEFGDPTARGEHTPRGVAVSRGR